MGKYSIQVLPIAQDDMKSIVAYIRLDNADAAIRMVEKIRAAISKLSDAPMIGAIPRDKHAAQMGYRMMIVEPYLVFYIVVTDDTIVEIHRVLHGRRDYPDIL